MVKQSFYTVAFQSIRWEPEGILDSYWLAKLINKFIKKGLGIRASELIYSAIAYFKSLCLQTSFNLYFMQQLQQFKPNIAIGHRRKGLNWIYIPYLIKDYVGTKTVVKWFSKAVFSPKAFAVNRSLQNRVNWSLIPTTTAVYEASQSWTINLQESIRYKHYRWI